MIPIVAIEILQKSGPMVAVALQKFLHKELIPALHALEPDEDIPGEFWKRPSFQAQAYSYRVLVQAMLDYSEELSSEEAGALRALAEEASA